MKKAPCVSKETVINLQNLPRNGVESSSWWEHYHVFWKLSFRCSKKTYMWGIQGYFTPQKQLIHFIFTLTIFFQTHLHYLVAYISGLTVKHLLLCFMNTNHTGLKLEDEWWMMTIFIFGKWNCPFEAFLTERCRFIIKRNTTNRCAYVFYVRHDSCEVSSVMITNADLDKYGIMRQMMLTLSCESDQAIVVQGKGGKPALWSLSGQRRNTRLIPPE